MTKSSSVHWFVVYYDGQPSLATASMTRRGAIKYWTEQAGKTWSYWYRQGMRARQVRVSWKHL